LERLRLGVEVALRYPPPFATSSVSKRGTSFESAWNRLRGPIMIDLEEADREAIETLADTDLPAADLARELLEGIAAQEASNE
jgi:hypothetical protein